MFTISADEKNISCEYTETLCQAILQKDKVGEAKLRSIVAKAETLMMDGRIHCHLMHNLDIQLINDKVERKTVHCEKDDKGQRLQWKNVTLTARENLALTAFLSILGLLLHLELPKLEVGGESVGPNGPAMGEEAIRD